MSLRRFDQLIGRLRQCVAAFPDRRTGRNKKYTMEDIGLGAFSVFYTQSPSFLAQQKAMQQHKGRSNAQTLFQLEEIPTDNHIRDTLDAVPPAALFPVYDEVYEALREQGVVARFQGVGGTTPIALDGTWYHSSENIHCPDCSHIQHQNGQITYYHSAITPVIVAPGQPHAIALRPEFITPQDGHDKQDCEIVAAKRWLDREGARYLSGLGHNATLLGDDLYARQPFCRRALPPHPRHPAHAQDLLRAYPHADALPLLPLLGGDDGFHDARSGDRSLCVRTPGRVTSLPRRSVP